jgi:predicted kinase
MTDLSEQQFKDFVERYRNEVAVPETKGKQFLLCPIGIVGAGKTTVLKPLAEKLGLVRISSDEIRKILKESGFNYNKTEDIAFTVARYFIDKEYGIAVDADCARPDKRKQLEEMAGKLQIPIIWIHINPPEEFILNKLKNYKHTWLFKNADEAIKNYEARKPLHQNLDFDFVYTFDTSKPDLDKQIEEAVKVIDIKSGLD